MDLTQLDLHDALLLGVSLDPVANSAEVHLAYYPNEQSGDRVRGTIRFNEVSHFNQLIDFGLMAEHAKFGNVSYWVTGESPGVTYIYLARGLIAVTSASVEFITNA